MKAQHAPQAINDPIVPKNLAAEEAIIGSFLLDGNQVHEFRESLKPQHLYSGELQTIYNRILQMDAAGQAVDLVTVVDELRRHNELEKLDGLGREAYVSRLIDGIPNVGHVRYYVEIVKDDAARRLAISQAQAIIDAGCEREDVAEIKKRFALAVATIEAPEERPVAVTADALVAMDVKPREWILENFVTARSMNQIFSWRGVGKTWLALGLGGAASGGNKFLKWQASRARRVLYVDGELDAASLQQRIKSLGAVHRNLKLLCCDMQDDPFPNLATARAQRMIESALGDDTDLMILDNLSALAPSSNETEAEDWIVIQSWLLNLRRQGLATIFLHHAGHSGWSRGTTRREDLLDLVIELRRPKDYVASEGLRFELHFTKTRGMLGAGAEPIEARLGTDLDGSLIWTWRDLEDARVPQIVELRNGGNSWSEIASITGVPRSTAERLYRNAQK